MPVADSKRSVYHISPLRLWLVPVMLLAFAIFMFVLAGSDTGTPETRTVAIYIGIFFLVFAAAMYFILQRTRLVLSAEGIKLHQFGYLLETDWANVAYLYDAPGTEGLVLHRAMECEGARTLNAFRNTKMKNLNFYSDDQIRLLAEQRLIPIDAFAYRLKSGLLRDDLVRYAPALGNAESRANKHLN